MSNIKTIISAAKAYLNDALEVDPADIRLEEIVPTVDDQAYDITLSIPGRKSGWMADLQPQPLGVDPDRLYKVVRVSQDGDEVHQMTIREFSRT